MKKIKPTLIAAFLMLFAGVRAADVMPYYYDNLKNTAIGFTSVKSPVVLRAEPDKSSPAIETLEFDFKENLTCSGKQCREEKVFSAYSKESKIALLTATDESEGWTKVCFNTQNPLCGWVEEKNNRFYNWGDFFGVLGRKHGLYYFKDIQKKDKILYSAPDFSTNSTGKIILPHAIIPWLVRGNWALVKVYDYDNSIKTGWINFRDENGKLKFFVKL